MIMAHQVLLDRPWRGLTKLTKMAAMAIEECLASDAHIGLSRLPVLLCTAEQHRPGRVAGIDDQLFQLIADEAGVTFGPNSSLVCNGRTSIAVALMHARDLIYQQKVERVLIVATDTLVTRRTLTHYEEEGRLLTPSNSNGFMAGEGACAFLIGKPTGKRELVCAGLGFAVETAHINSRLPLRGDGLTQAHKMALADAGRRIEDVDYRITDLSGEHYYFREAAFAFARLLRTPKEDSELWHPADARARAALHSQACAWPSRRLRRSVGMHPATRRCFISVTTVANGPVSCVSRVIGVADLFTRT